MKTTNHSLLPVALFLSLIFGAFSATSQTVKLKVNLDNIEEQEGVVCLKVWKDNDKFLKEGNEYKEYYIKADKSKVSKTIYLPKGEYALSTFHDKNEDKECNRNFIGLPLEKYGFSNNFKPKLSLPKFHQCQISLTGDKEVTIHLIK